MPGLLGKKFPVNVGMLRLRSEAAEVTKRRKTDKRYSPADVAVLQRRYDSPAIPKERKRSEGRVVCREKEGRVLTRRDITGLIIAYGINSLAVKLAASTSTSLKGRCGD